MLILHIESPSPYFQGDQVYRTFQPCFALAEHGDSVIAGTWLSPIVQEAIGIADVVVLCQVAWYDFLPIMAARKRSGLATVFEINDNFLALQAWNPAAGFYADPSNRALTLQLAHQADGLLLCSPGLVKRFARLNRNVAMLPNQLWDPPIAPSRPPGPVRIGWAGSGGHREDIRWIAPVLCETLQRHPEVHCSIMAQTEVHAMFDAAPKERIKLLSPGCLSDYRAFLSTVDIGVAPLLPTEFNRCRSDVKYLEYAAAGAVPVCSRAEPYEDTVISGHNGMLFSDPDELRAVLDTLIVNAPLRRTLSENALNYIQARRLERDHVGVRRNFVRTCLGHDGMDEPTAAAQIHALFKKHPTPTYRPHTRFWQVRLDHAEACLLEVTMADGKDEKTLDAEMKRAVKLAPNAYLPHIYYGRHHKSYGRGVSALKKACQLNPLSCLAPFLLGQVHLRVGAAQPAFEAFQATLAIAPDFAPAHEALARLALDAGRQNAAIVHLEAALVANPFFRGPATHLARIYLAMDSAAQGCQAAEALLRATIATGDPTWHDWFLLADALQRRRAWCEACEALETARTLAPQEDMLRARLAQLYLLQGKPAAARRVLKPVPPPAFTA